MHNFANSMNVRGSKMCRRGKQLLHDNRSVSPVISVILMVAVTVILAAVISTFVLGLGEDLSDTAPTTTIEAVQEDHQTVTFTHLSGESIDADNLRITDGEIREIPETVTAGDTIRIDPLSINDSFSDPSVFGEEVSLVFTGESSTILATVEVNPVVPVINESDNSVEGPPTDTRGDGFLDDVAGDGELVPGDRALLGKEGVEEDNIENTEYFNFSCETPDNVTQADEDALADILLSFGGPECEGPA